MKLNKEQREKLESHGHPDFWFICTTNEQVTLECDHCDEVLMILTDDSYVCRFSARDPKVRSAT